MGYQLPSDEDLVRIRALIDASSLASIETYECSARRHETPDENIEANRVNVEVAAQFRIGSDGFGIRLVCEAAFREGIAKVSTSGEYELEEGFEPSRRDVQLFGNEVAVMTVFPFLRESMSDITTRVFGKPLLLPIAERGVISFDLED